MKMRSKKEGTYRGRPLSEYSKEQLIDIMEKERRVFIEVMEETKGRLESIRLATRLQLNKEGREWRC